MGFVIYLDPDGVRRRARFSTHLAAKNYAKVLKDRGWKVIDIVFLPNVVKLK